MESFILFFQKCRLCLDEPGAYNIFAKDELPQDIYLCTGVKVHPTDNLPQKICEKCSKVISSAKQLREIATQTNEHLRTLFHDDSDDGDKIDKSNENIITASNNSLSSTTQDQTSAKNNDNTSNKHAITVRKDLFERTVISSSIPQFNSEHNESREKRKSTSKRAKLDSTTSSSVIAFDCTECSKSFESWKKYYLHKRMHNKTIVCPLEACGKRFAIKGDLEKHFRTHTGEKPFKCNTCSRSFSQKCSLRSHILNVHGSDDDDDDDDDDD
ncbi:zinc finger protein 845-like [Ostrinia furnacalis]|uniref:zinc finger protein 845-like n=1 Tax=Ostrinia furnacalis TaxID=93504 RepID=UPI001038ECFB|nr:zinc finger protein 845-like [Ostrinia furnacalis]